MQIQKRQAFTLTEILIALAIVGVMGAAITAGYTQYLKRAKKVATEQAIKNTESALSFYNEDMGRYPSNLDQLIDAPSPKGAWDGPYLEKLPVDGWKHEFEYNAGKDIQNKDKFKFYEIISHGASEDNPDDEIVKGR